MITKRAKHLNEVDRELKKLTGKLNGQLFDIETIIDQIYSLVGEIIDRQLIEEEDKKIRLDKSTRV